MRDSIPKPAKRLIIPQNRSQEKLQKWKELFNEIDPDHIHAYIKGEPEFPDKYKMAMDESRLEDVCNLDVQIYIRVGQTPYLRSYGNEIYCCPKNDAFAEAWIDEVDENLDTTNLVSWEAIYIELVERRNDFYGGDRIPIPPVKSE